MMCWRVFLSSFFILHCEGIMTTSGKENFRLKSYKNKSLNPDEMRRRREEEGLQLRKQKREEQVMHSSWDICDQSLNSPVLQCLCPPASPKPLSCSWPSNSYTVSLKSESLAHFTASSAGSTTHSVPHSLKCNIGQSRLRVRTKLYDQ